MCVIGIFIHIMLISFRSLIYFYLITISVGYLGELNDLTLTPNAAEVEQLFTVPLSDLLDKSKWVIRDFSTPVFTGNFILFFICIKIY